VKQGFDAANSRFDYQNDPDLVDCCIYEMQALTAKYRYLLREVHRLGITKDALAAGVHDGFRCNGGAFKQKNSLYFGNVSPEQRTGTVIQADVIGRANR